MENFKLTREQLSYLHSIDSVKETIEEWFPSEFPKLEAGKWYKDVRQDSNMLLYLKEITNRDCLACLSYGFNMSGEWSELMNRGNFVFERYMTLATPQEVEEALTKEAVKRGFKEGVNVGNFNGINKELVHSDRIVFDLECNLFYMGGTCIFKYGIWAEIVSEPIEITLEEIAKLKGVDVSQIKIVK